MLTLGELNDIRERVRLDREEDEKLQKRFGRRRPACGVDREKLLAEVDRLNAEVFRLNALCGALDDARDKAFARLDYKAAAFMAETLADQSGSAPQNMYVHPSMLPKPEEEDK